MREGGEGRDERRGVGSGSGDVGPHGGAIVGRFVVEDGSSV